MSPTHLPLLECTELETIVYSDETCIVAIKPSGLLCVPGKGPDKADCLIARVQTRFPDALIVHRLDQATSGLVLLARGKNHESALSKQFQQRQVTKHYIAIVDGLLPDDQGDIHLPLIADWPNRPLQKVDLVNGKPSHTHYEVLKRQPDSHSTLVKLTPHTGRSHQLRVHMMSLGHPILGDALYASRTAPRLMLHACYLQWQHPQSGTTLTIESPPDFVTGLAQTVPPAQHSHENDPRDPRFANT